jgi:hypothetical protein
VRFVNPVGCGSNLIPLNSGIAARDGLDAFNKAIKNALRNVHFEFAEAGCAVRLLGPDMYYHATDPFLEDALAQIDSKIGIADMLSYRSHWPLFDLCFEDSWSGYFMARHLASCARGADLVIIHLDDHTDMMSTLLEWPHQDGLVDPTTGLSFHPERPADWVSAIYSGVVGIGCFLTPFFFGNRPTHVRHVNNGQSAPVGCRSVIRVAHRHEIIPHKSFAAVKLAAESQMELGTYAVSSHCEDVLDQLPDGRLIVHIDLDYFVNDFNGNAGDPHYHPSSDLIDRGLCKLDQFFRALTVQQVKIDRWVVATSPGFCSGYHWSRLLSALDENIRALQP